jgi:hypothetical protein
MPGPLDRGRTRQPVFVCPSSEVLPCTCQPCPPNANRKCPIRSANQGVLVTDCRPLFSPSQTSGPERLARSTHLLVTSRTYASGLFAWAAFTRAPRGEGCGCILFLRAAVIGRQPRLTHGSLDGGTRTPVQYPSRLLLSEQDPSSNAAGVRILSVS